MFEPGEGQVSVEVAITDDEEVEGDSEVITLYLTAGDGATLSPHSLTYITVKDDDGKLLLYTHWLSLGIIGYTTYTEYTQLHTANNADIGNYCHHRKLYNIALSADLFPCHPYTSRMHFGIKLYI